jgi:hypothetical protein
MPDFHAWNLDKDGNIVDMDAKYFKSVYDDIALSRLNTTDYEFVYLKWDRKHKDFNQFVKDRKQHFIKEYHRYGLDYMVETYFVYGFCLQRALLHNEVNGHKVIIGSMGLKDKHGNIWWEHGNGYKNQTKKKHHVLNL